MLENMTDYFSFITCVISAFAGLYILFIITDKHHDEIMKDRQERYYSFYENTDDDFDDENRSDPYYE